MLLVAVSPSSWRSALTGRPPSRALRQERHSPDVGQRHTRSNEDVRAAGWRGLSLPRPVEGQGGCRWPMRGKRAQNAIIPRNGLCPREYPAACERTHRTKTLRRTRGGRKNDACFRACLPGIERWDRRSLSRRVTVRVTIQQSRAHSFQRYVAVESNG